MFANNQNFENTFNQMFFLYYLVMNKDNTLLASKPGNIRMTTGISFFARKFNVDSYVRNEDITSSPMLQLIEDELIKILSVQKYKKVFNHYLRVDDKYRLVWGPKK